MWIAEGTGEPQAGLKTFTGISTAGQLARELFIEPEGIDYAREHAVRIRDRVSPRERLVDLASALRPR